VKRLLLAASLLLGACAPQTKPKTVVQASTLAPLGPCKESSWRPDAPPPTASAKVSMVLLAVQEWFRFGRQTIDHTMPGPAKLEILGVQETAAPQRINDYWKSVDKPNLTGLDTAVPWSAAFISWDIESAGVSRDLFCPSALHTEYVERLVLREQRPGAVLIPRPVNERAPQPGDLLCAARDGGGTTLENLNRGRGAARKAACHRRQRRGLRDTQCLSTGRAGLFVAHCRPPVFHRDRKQTPLGRRTCPGPTTTSSLVPARPAAPSPTGSRKTTRCAS
jgi:hypothetical protein